MSLLQEGSVPHLCCPSPSFPLSRMPQAPMGLQGCTPCVLLFPTTRHESAGAAMWAPKVGPQLPVCGRGAHGPGAGRAGFSCGRSLTVQKPPSPGILMWPPLCGCRSPDPLSPKDIRQTGSETPWTSHLFHSPVSKCRHILWSWGLGLQQRGLGPQFSHNNRLHPYAVT